MLQRGEVLQQAYRLRDRREVVEPRIPAQHNPMGMGCSTVSIHDSADCCRVRYTARAVRRSGAHLGDAPPARQQADVLRKRAQLRLLRRPVDGACCHAAVLVAVEGDADPCRDRVDHPVERRRCKHDCTAERATGAPGTRPKGGLNGANDPKSPPGERWGGRDRGRTAVGVVACLTCAGHVALAVVRPLARVCERGHGRTRVE